MAPASVLPVIIDGFVHQLPDADPEETREWLDSLDQIIDEAGESRARFLMARLIERARSRNIGVPASVSTPYINTIPPEEEAWFPGDEDLERRIRRIIRWNAAVMVVRANKAADGIGGHLSTFASSATLYEVGFNHFFRGKADGNPGDHIYIQGHAAPGIYARAFLEHRLEESHLARFRREIGGGGLSSYPHPRLMPEFWEYPTVSMGLGPINSIYQARFNRYLHHRRLDDTVGFPGLVLPRRRGSGRARDAGVDLPGRPRAPRQPGVGGQLQPAAPRRPGAGQRQDHPGAGGLLPRAPAGT